MSLLGCKQCQPSDPATDTVKVNMPVPQRKEEEDAQRFAAEEEEARRRQAEEDAREQARLLAKREEDLRRAEFEKQQEQKRRELALAEEEEEARRRREEAERARQAEEAERARQAEEERLAQERQKRKEAVDSFLKANKFKGVGTSKRSMLSTTYPLHCAVQKCDVQMVEHLVREGADPQQKNSHGRTPAELAQKSDKKGSHAAILRTLGGA